MAWRTCVEINQCVGCTAGQFFTKSFLGDDAAGRWLRRAARNRHRHAIEQASRRWRGGRRDDSARLTRRRTANKAPTIGQGGGPLAPLRQHDRVAAPSDRPRRRRRGACRLRARRRSRPGWNERDAPGRARSRGSRRAKASRPRWSAPRTTRSTAPRPGEGRVLESRAADAKRRAEALRGWIQVRFVSTTGRGARRLRLRRGRRAAPRPGWKRPRLARGQARSGATRPGRPGRAVEDRVARRRARRGGDPPDRRPSARACPPAQVLGLLVQDPGGRLARARLRHDAAQAARTSAESTFVVSRPRRPSGRRPREKADVDEDAVGQDVVHLGLGRLFAG